MEHLSKAAASLSGAGLVFPQISSADVDVEAFEKDGMVSMPMGVSGQAGKAKPITGVVLRDGSEVSRDSRSGNVVAEILVGPDNQTPVLASFQSPWSVAKGGLFDVETRDAASGDGAFLTVAPAKGVTVDGLSNSFFVDSLFSKTGRFSFYGVPTDIRVKKSQVDQNGQYRYLEILFSNLSQSTSAEIPRTAIVSATVIQDSVVMLVSSSTTNRFKKGQEKAVRQTAESFRVALAPKTGMAIRAKERT